ncbi:zinc metalloprotease HtpX [Dendrosporobacter sp. 1207_IL3150]|uniref:zinc metalloprotease HtpX n=1 Tax=Dendrosporobacter sp. 1207_IL3150 TaxID=3084054 RepID=UPI002FDB3845
MNSMRTMLLLTGLTGLLLALGGLLGGTTGMTIMLVVSIVTNFVSYWYSDKIVLSMYGAKLVTSQDSPELIRLVSALAQKAKIAIPKVYLTDADAPNAFATGRNPENAAVVLTKGIINVLDSQELEAVLAHELAHIKNRDTLISTIVATVAGVITMVANIIQWVVLLGFGKINQNEDNRFASTAEVIVMVLLAPLAATLIQFGISRAREFKADETGSQISGNPSALASALEKIERHAMDRVMPEATPATSHMFIVNPFSGKGNWVMNLFSTHPETRRRVEVLKQLAKK